MEASKVITYSLLAQIRNSGNFVNSSVEIFVPIVKYALYKLITQSGVYKGASITEISTWICQYFGLDFPPAVLEKILLKIGQEINTSEELKLQVYRDGSFWIKNYSFEEFNDIYETNRQQVELVQTMFKQFCDINDVKKDSYNTIFDFVNLNKLKISNYLANRDYSVNGSKFSIEAQFVEYFRNIPGCYEVIRKIYLGSILSCYLSEYEPQDKMMSDVELLLDTNFIVSLLDLNTPESTTTCRQLLKIASSFGYSLRVLKETIKETTDLLLKKAEYFDKSFLPKLINPEDIYKACERRNLNRNDLERIADNLENILVDEYSILQIPYTVKYQNLAKSSTEYAEFKKIRNTDFAALHDFYWLGITTPPLKKFQPFDDIRQVLPEDERVIVAGLIPQQKAAEIIASCNVFLAPSRREGFPMALLEAMRIGCIPVVSDFKIANQEIIRNGINGYVIPHKDVKAFVDRLSDIVKNHENYKRVYEESYKTFIEELSFPVWRKHIHSVIIENSATHKQRTAITKSAFRKVVWRFKMLDKCNLIENHMKEVLPCAIKFYMYYTKLN